MICLKLIYNLKFFAQIFLVNYFIIFREEIIKRIREEKKKHLYKNYFKIFILN